MRQMAVPFGSHAFACIESILAFKAWKRESTSQEESFEQSLGNHNRLISTQSDYALFGDEELRLGFCLDFRLWVDCGHEESVIADLLNEVQCNRIAIDSLMVSGPGYSPPPNAFAVAASNSRSWPPTTYWNNFSITGRLRHFSDFIGLWNELWFEPSWREANLVQSETTLGFAGNHQISQFVEPQKHSRQRIWQLTKSVRDELADIERTLQEFARDFLAPPQCSELLGLFHCFRSCFLRHELFGTARDLLPFFRQLSGVFSLKEHWKDYLFGRESTPDLYEKFTEEIGGLLQHASRAIRNRVEFRSIRTDPPMPQSLDHGACILVSAYTVFFFLIWELFRRTSGSNKSPNKFDQSCAAKYFAACVCAGTDGKVVCKELFPDFRRFVEAEETKRHGLGVEQRLGMVDWMDAKLKWKGRILLLDISGKVLKRPEQAWVHCLHEVAELSDWIESDRCKPLRELINLWILQSLTSELFDRAFMKPTLDDPSVFEFDPAIAIVDKLVKGDRRTDMEAWSDVQEIVQEYIDNCMVSHLSARSKSGGPMHSKSHFHPLVTKENCRTITPLTYIDLLYEAIAEVGARKSGFGDFIKTKGEAAENAYHQFADRLTVACDPDSNHRNGSVEAVVESMKFFIMEVLADTGLWLGLQAVMEITNSRHQQEIRKSRSQKDLTLAFKSVLIAVEEACGVSLKCNPTQRIVKGILARWAVLAAAIWSDELWVQIVAEETAKLKIENFGYDEVRKFLLEEEGASIWRPSSTGPQFPEYILSNALKKFFEEFPISKLSFPQRGDFSDAEQLLFDAFCETWDSDANQRDEKRIELAMKLWAKSQRLGIDKALERIGK